MSEVADIILKGITSSIILEKRRPSIGGIRNLGLETRRRLGTGGGVLRMRRMKRKTNTRGKRGKRKRGRGERKSTKDVKAVVEMSIMVVEMNVLGTVGMTKFRAHKASGS